MDFPAQENVNILVLAVCIKVISDFLRPDNKVASGANYDILDNEYHYLIDKHKLCYHAVTLWMDFMNKNLLKSSWVEFNTVFDISNIL